MNVISSPPYADGGRGYGTDNHPERSKGMRNKKAAASGNSFRKGYGIASGQMGGMEPGECPNIGEEMKQVEVLEWQGCYDDSWKGIITPEAFAHPAKMARGLLCRILDYGLAHGLWKKGDTILDPFGGVGTTGIEAANRGIRAVCHELEPKFVALGQKNFELHRRVWEQFGDPLPVMVQGDSRKLAESLEAAGVLTSPPFLRELAKVSKKGIGSEGYGKGGKHIIERRTAWATLNHEEFGAYLRERRAAAGLSKAEMDRRLGTNTAYSFWEGRKGSKDQWRIPLPTTYRRLKEILGLDGRYDETLLSTEMVEIERRAMKMGHKEVDYGTTPGQLGAMSEGEPPSECRCEQCSRRITCEPVRIAADNSEATGTRHAASDAPTGSTPDSGGSPRETPSARRSTQKTTTAGRAATRVGGGSHGGSKNDSPGNETETSASGAASQGKSENSTSTTSKGRKRRAASGTTRSTTSEPSAVPATPRRTDSAGDTTTRLCAECAARSSSPGQQTRPFAQSSADARDGGRRIGNELVSRGAMPEGVLSSPPYIESGGSDYHIDSSPERFEKTFQNYKKNGGGMTKEQFRSSCEKRQGGYGTSEGNLGNMPAGTISSPPFQSARQDTTPAGVNPKGGPVTERANTTADMNRYGKTEGQVGSMDTETFWSAAAMVVRQCHLILPPGANTAWVVKNFVRDKAIVPFSEYWARLLESNGFEVFLEVRASLSKIEEHDSLFGGTIRKETRRVSFFRRLQEKKGSPKIDYETVWFARRK